MSIKAVEELLNKYANCNQLYNNKIVLDGDLLAMIISAITDHMETEITLSTEYIMNDDDFIMYPVTNITVYNKDHDCYIPFDIENVPRLYLILTEIYNISLEYVSEFVERPILKSLPYHVTSGKNIYVMLKVKDI